jgi:hypothetical protein
MEEVGNFFLKKMSETYHMSLNLIRYARNSLTNEQSLIRGSESTEK